MLNLTMESQRVNGSSVAGEEGLELVDVVYFERSE